MRRDCAAGRAPKPRQQAGRGGGATDFTAKVVSPAVVSPAAGLKRCGCSEASLSTDALKARGIDWPTTKGLRAIGYRL